MNGRYQLYAITEENGKDRWISSVRANSRKRAIELAEERAASNSAYVFAVADTKPKARSGGVVEKQTIIYNTVTKTS